MLMYAHAHVNGVSAQWIRKVDMDERTVVQFNSDQKIA